VCGDLSTFSGSNFSHTRVECRNVTVLKTLHALQNDVDVEASRTFIGTQLESLNQHKGTRLDRFSPSRTQ
jgi:hypothetical protein